MSPSDPSQTETNLPEKIGRYRIQRLLGSGAMGDVYLAVDPNIDRELAIKTVRVVGGTPDDVADRKQRLLREARAAGQFVHPNVVTLFDADETDGTLYLAFEYVPPGVDLARRMIQAVSKGPMITLRQALRWVREIAQALTFAHERGIVHRDIKPSNVLIAADGTAKVADFGIAKLLGPGTELTRTGSVVGSPQYMSPEQVRGETLDGRSDVFSLGVVFYELLCGIRPFGGETLSTLVFEILSKEPPPVGSLRPSLPGDLVALAHRMLAKDRKHRSGSAAEVVDAIRKLEASIPAHVLDSAAAPSDTDETRRMATRISAEIDARQAQNAEAPTVRSDSHPAVPPPPPVPPASADPTLVASQHGAPPPRPEPAPSTQPPPPAPTSQASPELSTSLPPRDGDAGQRSNTVRNVVLGLGVLAILGVLFLAGAFFAVRTLAPDFLPAVLGGSPGEAESVLADGAESPTAPDPTVEDVEDSGESDRGAEGASDDDTNESTGSTESAEDEEAALADLRREMERAEREPPPGPERDRREAAPPTPATTRPAPAEEPAEEPAEKTPEETPEEPQPVPPPRAAPQRPEQRPEPGTQAVPEARPGTQPERRPEPRQEPQPPPTSAVDQELERWREAAARADEEMSTGLHFRFDIKPKDLYVIVRVWPEGEGSIVKGAAENFRDGRNGRDMTLPGSGNHLVELLINGEVQHSILVHASAASGRTTTIQMDLR